MNKKTLISTRDCYEGHDIEEDCWIINTYEGLTDDENVDAESIEWSQQAWIDEKNYFFEMLEKEVEKYEKRYHTEVVGIALLGTIGLWNGRHSGGKLYERSNMENILNMDVDDIEVTAYEDGELQIAGSHHDGTHYMSIYFITENKIKKAGLYNEYYYNGISGINYFEGITALSAHLTSLKLTKRNGYFGLTK